MNKTNKQILIEIGIGMIIGILICMPIFVWQHMEIKKQPEEVVVIKTDTIHHTVTEIINVPKISIQYVEQTVLDTVYVERDTIFHVEQKHYQDTIGDIWISGIRPELDSVQYRLPRDTFYITTDIERTVKQKESWWHNRFYLGLGVTGGYSIISKQPDITVGLQAGIRLL